MTSFGVVQKANQWHAVALETRGLNVVRETVLDSWPSSEAAYASVEAHSFMHFVGRAEVKWQ